MSNLLKSSPVDTTPVGSRPTTIIQKVIEICESGATANRTGAEFGHIMRHQNSVFVYGGQPAACVAEENGVFSFTVLDASGEAPVLHTYTVDNKRKITQGADISFGGGSSLPDVTEADNGDVLTVVNGEWAKAEAGGGGINYDLLFSADSDDAISPNSTSVTITNGELSALASLETIRDRVANYGKVELAGGFHWFYEEGGMTFAYPAVVTQAAVVPNAAIKAQLPEGFDINDEDAIMLEISPLAKWSLYAGTFIVYENGSDETEVTPFPIPT